MLLTEYYRATIWERFAESPRPFIDFVDGNPRVRDIGMDCISIRTLYAEHIFIGTRILCRDYTSYHSMLDEQAQGSNAIKFLRLAGSPTSVTSS